MPLSIGLVGLPNAGKSTLFNALSRTRAAVASYPFTTIQPNVAVVPVPDARLDAVAQLLQPKRVVSATIEFVDIAGLIRGSHRGEGLGNQFLSHIRGVDAVAQVIRCFRNPDVAHVEGAVDPRRDVGIIGLELALADLGWVERRLEAAARAAKSGERRSVQMLDLLRRLTAHLNSGSPARQLPRSEDDEDLLLELDLLTLKPMMLVANVDDTALAALESDRCIGEVADLAQADRAEWVGVAAQLEAELAEWSPAEAAAYREAIGAQGSGLEAFIQTGYRLLDVVTFYTATGGEELRAWPIPRGTSAASAAGKVHSDMERGFIRAEVVPADDLLRAGSLAAAREHGLMRLEGRDYVVQDGEVVHFRFSA